MDLALILFLLTLVTGVIWLADKLVFRRRRVPGAPDPWWVEYGASFFPVLVFVFLLRSFVVEPFRIPSGSMIPTLLVGDFVLVNKFTYGIRLPIANKKVVELGAPQRGDVMVFRYPADPSLNYIKRVVGLPGDRVEYQDKRLTINGNTVETSATGEYFHPERNYYSPRFSEKLGSTEHAILIEPDAPAFVSQVMTHPFRDACIYNARGIICEVPAGHYFTMGDNRDASSDSRVWGFVPDDHIVGKAFLIWFNFSDIKRVGFFK